MRVAAACLVDSGVGEIGFHPLVFCVRKRGSRKEKLSNSLE